MKKLTLFILSLILFTSCDEDATSGGLLGDGFLSDNERPFQGSWRLISKIEGDTAVMLDSCALQQKITFTDKDFTQEYFSLNDENECTSLATEYDTGTFSVLTPDNGKSIKFTYPDSDETFIYNFLDLDLDASPGGFFSELGDTLKLTKVIVNQTEENSETWVRKYYD